MKKTYETPSVEVVKFQYRDQVVVASGIPSGVCSQQWVGMKQDDGAGPCHIEVVNPHAGQV